MGSTGAMGDENGIMLDLGATGPGMHGPYLGGGLDRGRHLGGTDQDDLEQERSEAELLRRKIQLIEKLE